MDNEQADAGRDDLARLAIPRFSGANGDRKKLISPVQLTTSRIGNLARLIHTLLCMMATHKYILYITGD